MRPKTVFFAGIVMLIGSVVQSQSTTLDASYGVATHQTTAWQELTTFDLGTEVDPYGVFWSVDNGATWGHDTTLTVGQDIQFMFNMHKSNVGTHYADFLKTWVDFDQSGDFDESDVVAFNYQELSTNEDGNLGSWNEPNIGDYTFYSSTFTLNETGDLSLRARVTCSHSLVASDGGSWGDQWNTSLYDIDKYNEIFLSTGHLHQGEVEEWVITVAPVPEPATMILFGTGLAGLVGYRRKMKK
jgi:hypothetical protein